MNTLYHFYHECPQYTARAAIKARYCDFDFSSPHRLPQRHAADWQGQACVGRVSVPARPPLREPQPSGNSPALPQWGTRLLVRTARQWFRGKRRPWRWADTCTRRLGLEDDDNASLQIRRQDLDPRHCCPVESVLIPFSGESRQRRTLLRNKQT